MSENNEAVMKKYGIQVEQSKTFIYNGYRYRNLDDAINYAKLKLKEGQLKVISTVHNQALKRGFSNAIEK